MRTLITAIIAILGLLTVATVASADHAWEPYHWPGDNLSPTFGDKTTSSLYYVPAGVQEWADLGTTIQPGMATGGKADIKVGESVIRSSTFLGLAGIYIDDDGHITKAEIVLNTRLIVELYGPNSQNIADHVLCQEIGHVLGLDHNRVDDLSPGDDTCMNDSRATLGLYTSPNSHDTDQLEIIYDGHTEPTSGGDEGGPDCSKNTNAKKCRSGAGQWVTVHVFWAP